MLGADGGETYPRVGTDELCSDGIIHMIRLIPNIDHDITEILAYRSIVDDNRSLTRFFSPLV